MRLRTIPIPRSGYRARLPVTVVSWNYGWRSWGTKYTPLNQPWHVCIDSWGVGSTK